MANESAKSEKPPGETVRVARLADAPIGATPEVSGVNWVMILLVFMRIAAVVWLLKGILHWAYIIGLGDEGFPQLRLSRQGIFISFAILDLVAAVGLWLTSSWGAAIWLIVLFAETALPFLVPDMPPSLVDTMVSTTFGLIYLFLVWKAFRAERAV